MQAVIDWYGISDLETRYADFGKSAPDKSEEGDFLGCEPALCPVGVAHNASPLAYIGTHVAAFPDPAWRIADGAVSLKPVAAIV